MKHRVESFYCDTKNFLSIPMLGKHMLNTAEDHATDLEIIHPKDEVVWVLARLNLELDVIPRVGAYYDINTWISKNYRGVFTDRCFNIVDDKGCEIGRSKTVWSLIDFKSRQSVNILDFYPDFDSFITDDEVKIKAFPKLKVKDMPEVAQREVLYSHLDKNCHLNSIAYIEFALDTFDLDYHSKMRVSALEVSYHNETLFGATLSIRRIKADDETYHFAFYNDTTCVCRVKLSFVNI